MAEGATKCIKLLVFFFNFLFFLFGIALVGYGAYAEIKFGPYISISSNDFMSGSRLLIAVGCIITIIAFFGCCGAWKENKCMLILFFILLLIVLGLEIAAAVLGYINKDKIQSDLTDDIIRNIKEYPKNNKAAIDAMQMDFECCGAKGPSDWTFYGQMKYKAGPGSCCGKPNNDACLPGTRNSKGCFEAMKDFVNDKLIIIAGLAIGLIVIQILGMILAMTLICRIHKGSYA
ncbi:predicted protein [Nematostella vectensis]|uniref:Tetraspanin n=1 Tax=Nematostella vectensis TaxID=45351 RepID=A7SZI2_NEMVE|nr:predicted protein [Nematostella vectensis]|eukprot:XP_001622984.1 predicted protein [Nematostella vectensis]